MCWRILLVIFSQVARMITLVVLLGLLVVRAAADTCEDNCSPNQYCSFDNCLDCFNCTILFREHSTSCAKKLNDCGKCLPGYAEIPLTTHSQLHKKSCIKETANDDGGCDEGHGCPNGYFCHQNRHCTPCFDCRSYYRLNPVMTSCAKSVEECGLCFLGYEDDAVTPSSSAKLCREQPIFSQRTQVHVNVGAISLIGAVGLIGMVALCVILVYRAKYYNDRPSARNLEQALPPPYSAQVGSESEISEPEITTNVVCGFYKERDESDNMARIFRLPEYIAQGSSSADREDRMDVVENENANRPRYIWPPYQNEDNAMVVDGNAPSRVESCQQPPQRTEASTAT